RTAARAETHQRQLLVEAHLHAAHEPFADDRSHRTTEKLELKRCGNQRHGLDAALHYDQRVVLAGFPIRLFEPVGVAPAVLELEAVDRHDFSADFEAGVDIEKPVEALARRDA